MPAEQAGLARSEILPPLFYRGPKLISGYRIPQIDSGGKGQEALAVRLCMQAYQGSTGIQHIVLLVEDMNARPTRYPTELGGGQVRRRGPE